MSETVDAELVKSVRFVLATLLTVLERPISAEMGRQLAEVLEGQAQVLREAAGG